MKIIPLFLCCFFMPTVLTSANAQFPGQEPAAYEEVIPRELTMNPDSEFAIFVDSFAKYPGGEAGVRQHVARNTRYPIVAQENGIQGRVIVTYTVATDGTITNIEIVSGVDRLLDTEAVRVIQTMERWEPAMKNGEPVAIQYTQPFDFRLN